jgi:2-haloacid dehalogenase
MTVKAVVFDIGRVLIGWDPEGFYDRVIGPDRRERLFAEVPLHAMNLGLDNGDPWRASVAALADRHPDWRAEVMLWHDRWIEMTGPVIDHSVRLLRALKARGLPVYGLTNFGGESFRFATPRYPFFAEFDGVAVSGDLRVMKPDPAIYAVIEGLSRLTGPALLFTDDNPANIAAAGLRGWKTHLFTTPAPFAARLLSEGLLTESEAA